MNTVTISDPLVSVDWLHANKYASNLVILDASITKVTDSDSEITRVQIPEARFFDLKNKFCNVDSEFPNTFPSVEQFQAEVRALGINKDSAVVIYDDKGIYSSPRAWWLFISFGHSNVAVLNGGLPHWVKKGYDTESLNHIKFKDGNFTAKFNKERINSFRDIIKRQTDNLFAILDARSADRFFSRTSEPRQSLRSGNIPSSKNLPYQKLLNNGFLKSREELISIFSNLIKPEQQIIMTCGSGITACILALGATIAGFKTISLYDGSWTEYGTSVIN